MPIVLAQCLKLPEALVVCQTEPRQPSVCQVTRPLTINTLAFQPPEATVTPSLGTPFLPLDQAVTTPDIRPQDFNAKERASRLFPLLEQITRPTIPTCDAAYYLNRKEQTLRTWACLGNGPIRPVKINGRLAWPVLGIRHLVNGG